MWFLYRVNDDTFSSPIPVKYAMPFDGTSVGREKVYACLCLPRLPILFLGLSMGDTGSQVTVRDSYKADPCLGYQPVLAMVL